MQLEPTQISEGAFQFAASFNGISFSASGDTTFIFKAWSEFLEHAVVQNHPSERGHVSSTTPIQQRAHSADPLSVFLDRTGKTDSNPKIAAAIVLWARRSQGKEEMGPNEVKALWRITRYKVPGNVPRELTKAAQNGWLERAGAGKYRVTGHGEEFLA